MRTTTGVAVIASAALLLTGSTPVATLAGTEMMRVHNTESSVSTAPSCPEQPKAQVAQFDLHKLPRPALDSIVAAPQTSATLEDVHAVGRLVFAADGLSVLARPHTELTPAYAEPGDSVPPILALEQASLEQPAAWLVTRMSGRWIQVLVPLGRGDLPSSNPAAVNGRAVWIRSGDVDLRATRTSVVVNVSQKLALITDTDGATFSVTVGVGKEGAETPRGLGSLVGFATNAHGLAVAVTSMQSTSIDGYDGANYAAFALHPDPEHGAALGKARSNGCIRMDAIDYARLVDHALPLGTPIWVVG